MEKLQYLRGETMQDESRGIQSTTRGDEHQHDLQSGFVIAKRYPRNQGSALDAIRRACGRPTVAGNSTYKYERGGETISGPNIDLLVVIAQNWGNIRFGTEELSRENGASLMRTFAWDLESNAFTERKFRIEHVRDLRGGKTYPLTDQRDIYEHTQNFAMRRLRACMEQIIPSDVISEAMDECARTNAKYGKKDRAEPAPQAQRTRKVDPVHEKERARETERSMAERSAGEIMQASVDGACKKFSELGVETTELVERFGELSTWTETTMAALRRAHTAMKNESISAEVALGIACAEIAVEEEVEDEMGED